MYDMTWIEGFTKAAEANGLNAEQAKELLKVAQRLHFLTTYPEQYQNSYDAVLSKQAQGAVGGALRLGGRLLRYLAPTAVAGAGLYGKKKWDEKQEALRSQTLPEYASRLDRAEADRKELIALADKYRGQAQQGNQPRPNLPVTTQARQTVIPPQGTQQQAPTAVSPLGVRNVWQ